MFQSKLQIEREISKLNKEYRDKCREYSDTLSQQEVELNRLEEDKQFIISNFEKEITQEKMGILAGIESEKKELQILKDAHSAILSEQLRQKKIEEEQEFYSLVLSDNQLNDIKLLMSIRDRLSAPTAINKIIWSNYYQPVAKKKFPEIIGKETACGIYKITCLTTGQIYIGQSVDVCNRFKEHCKNALGVGNTRGQNKLYKVMAEQGLHNFTFELLEECDSSQLNEKEKYYINFFESYNFGLNSTSGNK